MDGVRLREVRSYSVESDRWAYRWDAMVGDVQKGFSLPDVEPYELEKARERAREVLKDATAELPWPSWLSALNATCTYI